MKLLEIIVPHWTEPWIIGRKLFDMISLQRGVDFGQIRVTIIHDGFDCHLKELVPQEYPYEIRQINISHGGISAARNAGIESADARWIMFMDFDDMFAGVYSLRNILQVLDTDDFDMLWGDFYAEDRTQEGETILHIRGQNTVFMHGKALRLAWLRAHGLLFDERLHFNEDSAFNTIMSLMVPHDRIGKITCEAPICVWCYREGSATGSRLNRTLAVIGAYQRNRLVCDAFAKYAAGRRHGMMVARAACDAYWMFCLEEIPDELIPWVDDFRGWWKANRALFGKVDVEDLKEVIQASKREHDVGVMEEKRRWGDDGKMKHRDVGLFAWLEEMEG